MNGIERKSYLKALAYIATSDERIEKEEIDYLKKIGNLYGIVDNDLDEIIESVINKKESLEEVLSNIKNRQTKLVLLFELIALCYADGNYEEKEKDGMKEICKILNIEASKLEEIEKVMIENIKVQEKINTILER